MFSVKDSWFEIDLWKMKFALRVILISTTYNCKSVSTQLQESPHVFFEYSSYKSNSAKKRFFFITFSTPISRYTFQFFHCFISWISKICYFFSNWLITNWVKSELKKNHNWKKSSFDATQHISKNTDKQKPKTKNLLSFADCLRKIAFSNTINRRVFILLFVWKWKINVQCFAWLFSV